VAGNGVRDGGIERDIESGVEYCRELANWSRLIGKLGAGLDAGVEVGHGRSSEWSWAEGWVQSLFAFLGLVLAVSVVLCGMAARLTGNRISNRNRSG
jgi:hypothetical protein